MKDGNGQGHGHRLTLASVLFGVAVGLALMLSPVAKVSTRASYDWATLFQRANTAEGVVLIHVDEHSLAELGGESGRLDRRVYAEALDRLASLGAETVVFDILFLGPSDDPSSDEALARAIARHGRVILAGGVQETAEEGIRRTVLLPPAEGLRRAGAAWGIAGLVPDGDGVVRRVATVIEGKAGLAAVAAAAAVKGEEVSVSASTPILRYAGPPGTLSSYPLARLLADDGIPTEALRGATVFIGGRPAATSTPDSTRDTFATPFSRWGSDPVSPGVDLHAQAFLNLRDGDAIRRAPAGSGWLAVVVVGTLAGLATAHWSPGRVLVPALVAMLGLGIGGVLLQSRGGLWFNWILPAGLQVPVAVAAGAGVRYYVSRRERMRLKRAFAAYLSPHMAEEIARRRFDLTLGGKEVEATILFTDLQGFTALSENLSPEEVSRLLIGYFSRSTRSILEHDGTIIKYVGDAVMACWGAPLADERQADHALAAALELQADTRAEVAGHRLVTRVGIHSGPVLAGNLGSEFRFDYSCIGFTTNLASRLENLNKQLGTRVLLSGATVDRLKNNKAALRDVGDFQLSGTQVITRVFEPIDPDEGKAAWVETFTEGLSAWRAGDDETALARFESVIALRGGVDGPSAFFVARIRSGATGEVGGRRVIPLHEK